MFRATFPASSWLLFSWQSGAHSSPVPPHRSALSLFFYLKLNLLQRLGSSLLGYLFQQLSKLIIWGLCHTLAAIWTSRRARRLLWCYWLMLSSACVCTNSTPAAVHWRHATCAPPRISFLDLWRSPLFKKACSKSRAVRHQIGNELYGLSDNSLIPRAECRIKATQIDLLLVHTLLPHLNGENISPKRRQGKRSVGLLHVLFSDPQRISRSTQ